MTRMPTTTAVAAALLAAGVLPAHAEEVTLITSDDATLYDDFAGDSANGAGRGFFVGRNNSGSRTRSVIRFDVASAVPAGATIDDVTLTLYCSRTISPATPVSLHRVTTGWSEGPAAPQGNGGAGTRALEGDVTWFYTSFTPPGPGSPEWNNQGGDFIPEISGSTVVEGEARFYTWSSEGITADVQAWADGTHDNFGWLVMGVETQGIGRTSKRFASKEETLQESWWPRLTISYTTGGGCTIADVAEPFGILDLADVQAFVAGFLAQDQIADVTAPAGVWDLADVLAFVSSYNAGCP